MSPAAGQPKIVSMKRAVLGLAMLVAVGCDEAPPDGAQPLTNAREVAEAIYERWHEAGRLPPLYGVPTNCIVNGWLGFKRADGKCVVGRTIWDWSGAVMGVYLVVHPGARYSHALPHELIHVVHGHGHGHVRADLWEIRDPILSLEALTKSWLASKPELDITPSIE